MVVWDEHVNEIADAIVNGIVSKIVSRIVNEIVSTIHLAYLRRCFLCLI